MKFHLLLPALLMTLPPTAAAAPTPPDAARQPHAVTAPFGASREDDYYWLRDDDRKDEAMLAYLKAENAYTDAVMAPLKPLQDTLYEEIVGRIKQDDSSVPYRERGWWYYSRYETGKDYPVHARRKDGPGIDALSLQAANARGDFAGEQVLLDVNTMAEGKGYFSVGDYAVSQDNRILTGPRTRSAVASTRSISATWRPARRIRKRSKASRPILSGPMTTAPCSTSRTIRRRCSPCA